MDPPDHAAEENRRLRRTMRDLVALSTLPAVWAGLGQDGIARSLADALLHTLALDLVYVRLADLTGEGGVEVARGKLGPGATGVESVRVALAPLLESETTGPPAVIPAPSGEGMLNVAVTRFGVGDVRGVLVAGSRKVGFPTDQDRLLLGVGANQTAIVVQRRRAEERVQEQREWLRVTLASIGDAVIATDTSGSVTFLNDVARELTGWRTPGEAEGEPLEAVFVILNEETRRPAENPVERVLREGVVVGLANHTVLIARDGAERPIDDSAAPIRDAAGELVGVVLIFRDVTEQRRAEQQRNARLAVTQALGEAATVEDGTGGVLRAVCENLGWDLGLFWALEERADALVCRQAWHRPEMPVIEFERDSCSRTFAMGEGLPGRAWASGRPAWILDVARDTNFPRHVPAVGCGLHSAFACPVGVGDRTLGVIEFFSRRVQEPDSGLLEVAGTVAGSVGQFIERKAVEDELRRSERELADFFDNATIGLHWVGPDGTVLRANQAELDMLGYGREEYVGRPIADFHADPDVICDILRRLNSGEKLAEYPARLRCKDGTVKDVLIDSSVLWRDGQFVHTRCFTRDVTERKRAAAEVRNQEQRTRTILESITDAFFALGRDWRFTYVNRRAEEFLGRRRDDLLGKPLWEEFAPALGTEFERGYRRAMDEGVTVTFEEFYAPHDRWYEVHAYPSPDGLSVYFRDATGRRRHEEERERLLAEAQEANRAKTQFLAVLSHELRTPLNPILLASSAMLERPGDPEELRPTLEMIRQNVLLQARLIDDLLDVMRIVRGKMPLHWEVADGHTIVGRAVEVCRGEVLGRQLHLTLEMAAANRHVNADPARLQQVFWNLIKNAVKFTPEGGSIRVRTRNDSIGGERRLVVEVSDTGIGIEPDVLPRIFDPFQQGETTITRKFGGLGLGLAICKGIVEAHGGLLVAESGGRGRGTTFRVVLKALPEPAAEGDGEPAGRTPAASGDVPPSSLRILVVEDEPATLRLMARLLRGLGHEAATACTIAQAIEMFEAGEFDLIVSDIGLPDGSGLDLMRRAVGHRGPVAAIALTGYGMEEDIRRSREAGFTAHLTKPIDFAKLEAMIRQVAPTGPRTVDA